MQPETADLILMDKTFKNTVLTAMKKILKLFNMVQQIQLFQHALKDIHVRAKTQAQCLRMSTPATMQENETHKEESGDFLLSFL